MHHGLEWDAVRAARALKKAKRSAVEKLARFGAAMVRVETLYPEGPWELAVETGVLIRNPDCKCEGQLNDEPGCPREILSPDVAEYLARLEPQSATTPGAER